MQSPEQLEVVFLIKLPVTSEDGLQLALLVATQQRPQGHGQLVQVPHPDVDLVSVKQFRH